jgi:hypothetical protein
MINPLAPFLLKDLAELVHILIAFCHKFTDNEFFSSLLLALSL